MEEKCNKIKLRNKKNTQCKTAKRKHIKEMAEKCDDSAAKLLLDI